MSIIVKVKADGTPIGTRVTDQDGRELQYLTGVSISHRAGELSRIELDLAMVEFEVHGEAHVLVGSHDIASITRRDGTVVTLRELLGIEP